MKQALLKFGGSHKKAAAESAPPKQKHVLKALFFVAFVFKIERKPYARNEDYCADDNHYGCHHAYRVVLGKAAEGAAVAVSAAERTRAAKAVHHFAHRNPRDNADNRHSRAAGGNIRAGKPAIAAHKALHRAGQRIHPICVWCGRGRLLLRSALRGAFRRVIFGNKPVRRHAEGLCQKCKL